MRSEEPALAGSRHTSLPWLALGATLAIQTLVAVAVYCAPVMAPVAARAMTVAPEAVGWFIAVVYLGSMLGSITAGGWVARLGPIRVSQIGLLLCLAGLAFATTATVPGVLLAAFVIGLGYGPSTPASSQILLRASPPSFIALTFSIKQTGVPLGGAIAGATVPLLVLAIEWQGAALVVGAACAALALCIEPLRSRYDRALDASAPRGLATLWSPVRLVLGSDTLRRMAVASFVFGGVQITLVTYLVTFLTERFAMTLVLAGMVMAISQVASVAGRVLWGILADRVFSCRTMLGLLGLGMGCSALVTLAASPAWPPWLLFVFAALFGATAVGWNGVYLAEVARVAPDGRISEATGGCLFFTFLGVVVTPPAFNAVLALSSSYSVAYAVFGVPALVVGAWLLATQPVARAR